MIKYYKLFDLLARREMKKTDLLNIISPSTLAKLGKGSNINTSVINKICLYLKCQPSDIMEVIEEYGQGTTPDEIIIVKNELKNGVSKKTVDIKKLNTDKDSNIY